MVSAARASNEIVFFFFLFPPRVSFPSISSYLQRRDITTSIKTKGKKKRKEKRSMSVVNPPGAELNFAVNLMRVVSAPYAKCSWKKCDFSEAVLKIGII